MPTRSRTRRKGRSGSAAWGPWWAAVGAGTAGAAALGAVKPGVLERYIRPVPPTVALPALGALGHGALRFLERRGMWSPTAARWRPGSFPVAVAAAIPFGAAAIAVDIASPFPEGMNVDWPASLLFYPTIALAAEVAFHLAPLAGLTWLSRSRFTDRSFDLHAVSLLTAVAAVEPTFQVLAGSTHPGFVVPHVYLIGLVQLALLRRYGYLPMLVFRLAYYVVWHITWGAARVPLLFR